MKTNQKIEYKAAPRPAPPKILQATVETIQPAPVEQVEVEESQEHFSIVDDDSEQQIVVQTEDGSLLNMNNFILTENGEFIIQNLEGLLPNGQEGSEDQSGQIHISNLEQFLMEQGLSGNTEISYIQPDEGQVIIQNDDGTISQSSQESLMQTYKGIFEPDENIPTELIAPVTDDNALLNGDYISMSMPDNHNNGQIAQQVEVQNSTQVDANQSTLDELGDILLEVAAAAENKKKPKVIQQKIVRDSLWGSKKRQQDPPVNNGPTKKRFKPEEKVDEDEPPASNFSQAYEFFVKGFDAKKQKML